MVYYNRRKGMRLKSLKGIIAAAFKSPGIGCPPPPKKIVPRATLGLCRNFAVQWVWPGSWKAREDWSQRSISGREERERERLTASDSGPSWWFLPRSGKTCSSSSSSSPPPLLGSICLLSSAKEQKYNDNSRRHCSTSWSVEEQEAFLASAV